MSWFRLEDSARSHRKFLRVGPEASWLWACCGMYAVEHETDGLVPREALATLGNWIDLPSLITKLLEANLIEDRGDSIAVHDYLEYNISAAEAATLRRKRAKAGRAGALSRSRQTFNTCSTSVEHMSSKTSASASVSASELVAIGSPVDLVARIAQWHAEAMLSIRATTQVKDTEGARQAAGPLSELADDATRKRIIETYVRSNDSWPTKCRHQLRGLNASEVNRLLAIKPGTVMKNGMTIPPSPDPFAVTCDLSGQSPWDD